MRDNISASEMPSCATYNACSPLDSKKGFDYFQRRKVGSIRDNPKLLKIRQQFEKACQETSNLQENSRVSKVCPTDSAPSSFSLSKSTGTVVLDELLKINSKFSDKTKTFLKSELNANRRHSEGEIGSRNRLTIFSHDDSVQSYLPPGNSSERKFEFSSLSTDNLSKSDISNRILSPSKSNESSSSDAANKSTVSASSSESGIHTNSSTSEEDTVSDTMQYCASSQFTENKNLNSTNAGAPPIPKRGISPAVQNSFIHSHFNPRQKSISKELSKSSHNGVAANNVQKAIQMYEGMSSSDIKKNKSAKCGAYQKLVIRKDSCNSSSKKPSITRRSSRRNSLRKSKGSDDSKNELCKAAASQNSSNTSSYVGDTSAGMTDEEKNQSIYQTLSNVVDSSRGQYDPYDRLSRLHDVMNRTHKGQSSTCAACKAIPSSVLQYQADESSLLQVKCNEVGPHHHPPCICFSCQHSIFSCSLQTTDISPTDADDEDSLYYNVCCLNSPNRESWRQSRRRPVCEQNGRLCIVNCDIEQQHFSDKTSEEFYEKLCEWQSKPSDSRRQRHLSKLMSGDSCDSDEGWVDVTDSEDERNLTQQSSSLEQGSLKNDPSVESSENLIVQNSAYGIDHIISSCGELDISRSSSTEHLYESIADIDSQNINANLSENVSPSSTGSSTLSLKSEQNPENELDSGEWSTESPSPTFDESSSKNILQSKDSTASNQCAFTLNLENQETAKKTFMKSVLGKKGSPKKRRMSNFFVPWLVSNHEYGSSSNTRASKAGIKKQNARCQATSSRSSPCKNKRSQSIPCDSPKLSMSCTKIFFSSSELLDKCKGKRLELDNCSNTCLDNSFCLSPDVAKTSSSTRGSVASSTYLRADQLHNSGHIAKAKTSISPEAAVDVNVERVCKRSSSGDEHSYILFQPVKEEEVPLYQFYERNIKERVSFCRSPPSMSPIMWSSTSENNSHSDTTPKTVKPQYSVVEQLSPDTQDMKMLWCELPEVKDSGILERISAQELKLQEAAFEFIQSQASYIRSLKVLYENFIRTPEFSDTESPACVLSKHEYDVLFSDILRVKEVSERLMYDLTARWSDGILIPDICDIIHHHANLPSFSVYVRYCSNRVYQERTLKELKETRLCFLEVLRKLESNPACQGLSLESFLFLPMQHIARLPLLLDNIFRWLIPESPSYGTCKMALEAMHKIFMECNEGARKMERLEEMFILNKQLEFKDCKAVPLISASRWLLKKGELMKLEFDKKTFGRSNRCVRVPVYIFLFNDLLVVTKRKSEDSYTVVDYCPREKVQAMVVNAKDLQQPVVVPNTCRYLLYLTLFQNHQGSAVDMIISCTLLSERTRWIEAIHSVPQNKPCEVWEYDCPQVQCVRNYIAQQPDELSLQESDVVTIHRKMNDGWYEGRRLRDGLQGWFPASYTMDIPCSRARASNLRQCYRLLMLSQPQ